MKTFGLIVLLVLGWMGLSPAPLLAQPDHIFSYSMTPTETPTPTTASIDLAKDQCLTAAKTLTRTCACFDTSRTAWQAELDHALVKLQRSLTGTAGAAALQQSQTDWIHYQESELAYADSILAANPGAAAKVCALKTALVAARARELDLLLDPGK